MRAGEATSQSVRHSYLATKRQGVHDVFPGSNVVLVAHAWKFGDPQVPVGIDDLLVPPIVARWQ